ncbi:hypothetical protein HK104_011247 [Borealophlyctis nickersoniae]|nr:hypothetical protein HK104_011247 [Borealophlyctis nickersoniae]
MQSSPASSRSPGLEQDPGSTSLKRIAESLGKSKSTITPAEEPEAQGYQQTNTSQPESDPAEASKPSKGKQRVDNKGPAAGAWDPRIIKSSVVAWSERDENGQGTARSHRKAGSGIVSAGDSIWNAWSYSFRETSRHKSQFCIGCCSVFLVVFTVALFMTVITIAPVIFLSLAERTSGETDLTLVRRWGSGFARINYTRAASVLKDVDAYTYHSPRISQQPFSIYNAKKCTGWDPTNPTSNYFTYYGPNASATALNQDANMRLQCVAHPKQCIDIVCSGAAGVSSSTWIIDSAREKAIGIGRAWTLPPVPAGSVYLGKKTARNLGVGVGDWVLLAYNSLSLQTVYGQIMSSALPSGHSFAEVVTVNVPLKVDTIFDEVRVAICSLNGMIYIDCVWTVAARLIDSCINKVFPSFLFMQGATNKFPQTARGGNMALLEYSNFLEQIAPYYHPNYPSSVREATIAASRSGAQYAESSDIVFACGQPRYKCYSNSNWNEVAKVLVQWGSQITFRVGYELVWAYLDTLYTMEGVSTISQFLGLIATIVIALLCVLSCFLIYSLLMVSVETRTFELGVLRMIGQTRKGIVSLLLIQATTYSLPAWVLGLTLSQLAFGIGKKYLEKITFITLSPMLTSSSVAVATILGLVVPILAAIMPIRQALSSNLRDSLDKRHGKTKAVVITIERSGPGSLASIAPLAITGGVLAAIGFIIYYLLPLALVKNNLPLLFNIFMGLILGMLFGLVMLSFNVQPMMERTLLWGVFALLFFETRALKPLVSKNLLAHRMRNRKTATMFSFALGFLIFLSVNLAVQLSGMEYDKLHTCGAQVLVESTELDGNNRPTPIPNIARLESICQSAGSFVKDWAYTSYSLYKLDPDITESQVANIGQIAKYKIDVVAVTPNFLNLPALSVPLLKVSSSDPGLSRLSSSLSQQLYTPEGQHSAILSSNLRDGLGFPQSNFTQPFLLKNTKTGDPLPIIDYSILQPLAFLDASPYVRMTKYPTSRRTAALVSFPTYVQLTKGYLSSVDDIPLQSMHIVLDTKDPAYKSKLANLVNDLGDAIAGTYKASVTSLDDELDGIRSSRNLLNTIFNLATILVVLITLFSLNGCMYTNITEQAKELGVMRALGVSRWAIFRIYSYEAFVLTLGAGLLGTIIGAAIGWSMAAQRAVMAQTPLSFPFPWDIVIVMVGASVLSAFFSTAEPVRRLVFKQKIVSVLRD